MRFRGRLLLLALLSLSTGIYIFYRETRIERSLLQYQNQYRAWKQSTKSSSRSSPNALTKSSGQPLTLSVANDRCPSCHLGIMDSSPAKIRVPHPYRRHPGPMLSLHDPGRFGCTSCHGAGGEYRDRCLPARGDPDGQALNAKRASASCLSCHAQSEALPGADRLTTGLRAYRRLGCGGCHRAQGLDAGRMVGPPLDQVAQKLSPTYASSFIADPQRIRPGTAMPSFFSAQIERGAPNFTVAKIRRQRAEQTQDLLDFLWSLNAIIQPKPNPELANAQTGKEIFNQIGCLACHQAEEKLIEGNSNFSPSLIGPDLSQAGARLSPTWIQHWLASPQSYFPETRMPNFRLHSDAQLALTAYLHSLGVSSKARLALPYRPNRQRSNRGRVLAEKLGCAGCHSINVLKNAPVAGPELDGFGEKPLGQLDWGHAAIPVPQRSTWRWIELKLTQPLIFDRHPGILVMPWQFLRPGELEGILLVLRSLYKNEVAASNVAQPQINEYRQRRGEQWIGEFHCRQCHRVNDRGGAIAARYEYAWDQPPNLNGQGRKVLPGWMYNFISQPTALRPWLQLRMPTPAMKGSQREAIVAYLAALDKASYPFVHQPIPQLKGERLNQAQQLFQKFQCIRCHLLSNAGKLQPGELAPDLALSRERLRREWIYQFIIDPQKIMPGTRMPTFFLLVDEDDPKSRMTPLPQFFQGHIEEQINALVDLNLWWSTAGSLNVDHR